MATADFTRIATNIGALNALQSLRNINNKLGVHQNRLATGKRINSAADDPAGLTIATKMLARSEGLKVAMDNIGDANNMLSVAEAGLGKLTDILVQMRSKSEQAASDTLGASERAAIAGQLESLAAQIDNIVDETKWNGVKLLDGTVNKRFQTGADEGEFTSWQLSQEHTAATLNVSTAYTTAGFANTTTDASFTGRETAGSFNGLSELFTGTYSFEVLDKAADATDGKVNLSGELLTGITAVQVTTATSSAEELASGTYTITIDGVNGSNDIDYTIRNDTGAIVETADAVDLSANGSLVDAAGGNEIGIELNFGGGDAADLVAGDTMTFEYIHRGEVKLELNDASNQAIQIDEDGSAGGNTNTFVYGTAGAEYDTGKGVKVTLAAIGSVTAGHQDTFDYHKSGDYVVDVSTAVKAASYMTTVNNSLDIVNTSMSDLGSLMARLNIKSEAVAAAQVNTEAAHNRIMNADMAFEQLESTKFSILQQTAITMLSQANTAPQGILGLFR